MVNPPTAAELRRKLQQAHPADRQKVQQEVESDRQKMMKDAALNTVNAAKTAAQNIVAQANTAVASTSNRVNELNAEVERLTKALADINIGLQVRKRMTPQDMRDALNGLFDQYNFSPAEELVMMLKNPSHPFYIQDAGTRVRVLQDLNSYVMPKLKSTEIKGEVEHKHTITILRIGEDGTRKKEELAARPIEVPTIKMMEVPRE